VLGAELRQAAGAADVVSRQLLVVRVHEQLDDAKRAGGGLAVTGLMAGKQHANTSVTDFVVSLQRL
jgi:hypothetical protein